MPAPSPQSKVRALLEIYVRAKDLNQPDLIAACFDKSAELTFSIDTDDIEFPRRVSGEPEIARTLVTDFGKRFDHCRTYYVCTSPQLADGGICEMPWLVIMRHIENRALRLGKGRYRWQIGQSSEGADRIQRLHIHIEIMDTIPDPDAVYLDALHSRFGYPWLPPQALSYGIASLSSMRADPNIIRQIQSIFLSG
ncbi:hypothetical protein [Burkholderia cepacia]|uniref:hypothetical protein n=1 Tax=Burkholderia cepacia TaxID=292 RepID=UPI00075E0B49|nr:hypothetical protein [Burkholderia cepacia]KVW88667.1 hypothetical protein WL00_12855 [Burkholderia cepacia]KVX72996.1 hypothetical protein WL07_13030 [Burkholderia cepacia]